MATELPEDLQSINLLSWALLNIEGEFDTILYHLPTLEGLDQCFLTAGNQDACNGTPCPPSVNKFQDPVSEEEVKAAQKAVVPHNTQNNTGVCSSTQSSLRCSE